MEDGFGIRKQLLGSMHHRMFWQFSSMPFIQLVLVPPRFEVCPRNLHQLSYPNLPSNHEITTLDQFSDFSFSEVGVLMFDPTREHDTNLTRVFQG